MGWCWASQRYIAARVGNSEDYIHESVKLFEKDGLIRVREWVDSMGYPHREYQIVSEEVEAHQRTEGYLKEKRRKPRQGGNKTANAGSFKPGNKAAKNKESHTGSQPLPTELAAVCPPELAAVSPTAVSPSKGVVGIGGLPLAGFDFRSTTTASDLASSAPPAAGGAGEAVAFIREREKQPQHQNRRGFSPSKDQNQKQPTGTVVKGVVKTAAQLSLLPRAVQGSLRER